MLLNNRLIFFLIPFILFACAKPPQMKEEKSIFVKFKAAGRGEIVEEFSTAGELKADEDVLVSAQRPGRVIAVNVREGQFVKAGMPLVEISGTDVDADLVKAKKDFETYKKLFDEGAISQLELNSYQANYERLISFKNDLLIRATVSGQIGELMIDKGDYVKEGDSILELVKLYPLELSYTIPERLLAKVALGQTVYLTTDAYPGKEFTAKVKFISPKVDPNTRATLVRANVVPSGLTLKANQYVNVRQVLAVNKDILLVPEEAIYLDQGQEYVFTAQELEKTEEEKKADKEKEGLPGPPPPTHLAHKNKIETGLRKPGFVQIVSGIKEGDQVIYAGLTSIYEGAKLVQVKEKEAN
jgi:RND family efflux transporter MFP subunit